MDYSLFFLSGWEVYKTESPVAKDSGMRYGYKDLQTGGKYYLCKGTATEEQLHCFPGAPEKNNQKFEWNISNSLS